MTDRNRDGRQGDSKRPVWGRNGAVPALAVTLAAAYATSVVMRYHLWVEDAKLWPAAACVGFVAGAFYARGNDRRDL